MKRTYFVMYNGKCLAIYKRIHAALDFISKRKLKDDWDNSLDLTDQDGNMYSPINGSIINY